jgi:hypothetical protein
VLVIIAHVITTVLDPFAHITVRDVVVPVGAAYRPVWLGLGVVALEILLAVSMTSLLRDRIGQRTWRLIHWSAYGAWPISVVHGLGTGSDGQAPWMIGVVTACVAAVVVSLSRRLIGASSWRLRLGGAVATGAVLYTGTAWAMSGPLQPGWVAKSGTPPPPVTSPAPVHSGPGGFTDPLVGVMTRDAAGNTSISFRDTVDTALTITVRPPGSTESMPVVTVARGTRQLCAAPADATSTLYTVCGTTPLTITIYAPNPLPSGTSSIRGQLASGGPLK